MPWLFLQITCLQLQLLTNAEFISCCIFGVLVHAFAVHSCDHPRSFAFSLSPSVFMALQLLSFCAFLHGTMWVGPELKRCDGSYIDLPPLVHRSCFVLQSFKVLIIQVNTFLLSPSLGTPVSLSLLGEGLHDCLLSCLPWPTGERRAPHLQLHCFLCILWLLCVWKFRYCLQKYLEFDTRLMS